MNAMSESHDKGWKLIATRLREDGGKQDAELAKRETAPTH